MKFLVTIALMFIVDVAFGQNVPEYGFVSKTFGTITNERRFDTRRFQVNIDVGRETVKFISDTSTMTIKILKWIPATHGWTTVTTDGDRMDIVEDWSPFVNAFVPTQLIWYKDCVPQIFFN